VNKGKKDFALNLLRRGSYQWAGRAEAKTRARIRHGVYKCAICENEVRAKEMQMDHITPVKDVRCWDESLDELAEKMFVGAEGWQVACLVCHKNKTRIENTCRDEVTASIKKMNKAMEKFVKNKGVTNES
jgi:5-methylcytosine-specific restriction endonuclease McrA